MPILSITTTTGGHYLLTGSDDGTYALVGTSSFGGEVHEIGDTFGLCIHPTLTGQAPVFWFGDADPVDIQDGEVIWDATRKVRTAPVASIVDGQTGLVLTAAQAHDRWALDHMAVPLSPGHADPANTPVATHDLDAPYCIGCDTYGDLFGCQPVK